MIRSEGSKVKPPPNNYQNVRPQLGALLFCLRVDGCEAGQHQHPTLVEHQISAVLGIPS